jgi:hypothetical protein
MNDTPIDERREEKIRYLQLLYYLVNDIQEPELEAI